jgi:hypothetical protein
LRVAISADPRDMRTVIITNGVINIRLYISKYIYHIIFIVELSLARYESIVRYGPQVQGSKNKLMSIPIKNAHIGECIFFIQDREEILNFSGISIVKYFPNQK